MSQGSNFKAHGASDETGTLTFWKKNQLKAIASKIDTAEHKQANHDPEYLSKHANECRDHKAHTCHPEAVKRITKEMELKQHKSVVPTVIRPVRVNR